MNKSIQYLRALAALMVVWQHSLFQVPGNLNYIHIPEFGASGVDLFFVISGFIMFITTTAKPATPREFIGRRLIRVIPLYWLMTMFMVAIALVEPNAFRTLRLSPGAVLQSLLFIPYESLSFPGNAWPILVPGWTLNYEMFFYAIFAVSLAVQTRWRLTLLLSTLLGLVLAGKIIGPSHSALVSVYTNPLLLEFGAGAVIGRWWLDRSRPISLSVSVLMIVTGAALLVLRDSKALANYTPMIGAVMMVSGCLHPSVNALKSRLLLRLGDASYSIYLTHIFTLGAVRVVWLHLNPTATLGSTVAFMSVALISCAAAGLVVCHWVEQPLIARLRRRRELPVFKPADVARAPA